MKTLACRTPAFCALLAVSLAACRPALSQDAANSSALGLVTRQAVVGIVLRLNSSSVADTNSLLPLLTNLLSEDPTLNVLPARTFTSGPILLPDLLQTGQARNADFILAGDLRVARRAGAFERSALGENITLGDIWLMDVRKRRLVLMGRNLDMTKAGAMRGWMASSLNASPAATGMLLVTQDAGGSFQAIFHNVDFAPALAHSAAGGGPVAPGSAPSGPASSANMDAAPAMQREQSTSSAPRAESGTATPERGEEITAVENPLPTGIVLEGSRIEGSSLNRAITGTIRNASGRAVPRLTVEFNFFNANGDLLGNRSANVQNVETGRSWVFRVGGIDAEVASFRVVRVSTGM